MIISDERMEKVDKEQQNQKPAMLVMLLTNFCHFFQPHCFIFSLFVSLLAENLCFWQACEDVRHGESSKIIEKVEEIHK